ncbi:MAG TPA: hypothetical protein VKT76_17210 [Bradyrhizobium sp.]|nr:hypothetical protein [Bradyrhizobium sp.]
MIYLPLLLVSLLAGPPDEGVSCRVVKRAVAQYGEAVAEAWARARGLSDKDIERAKRCLK